MGAPILYGRANGLWRSLVSALDWGSRGPEFKSRQPDQPRKAGLTGDPRGLGLGHSPVQLQPADSDRPRPAASGWPVSSVWLAGQLGPGSGASLDRIVSH